jgi:iron complex outermembrane receptor protein
LSAGYWSWEINTNLAYNHNTVRKGSGMDDPDYPGYKTGGIFGGVMNTIQIQSVGFPVNSFFVLQQVYDANGRLVEGLYADRNRDGEINENDYYRYRKSDPDVIMGIASDLNYKNWEFSFSGRMQLGNYVYNNICSANVFSNAVPPSNAYLSNVTKPGNDIHFSSFQLFSDYYVENASFFKMDFVSLGYQFNRSGKNSRGLCLSGIVQNVFTFTRYSGQDPEHADGIDGYMYPGSRVFLMEIKFDL